MQKFYSKYKPKILSCTKNYKFLFFFNNTLTIGITILCDFIWSMIIIDYHKFFHLDIKIRYLISYSRNRSSKELNDI